MVDLFFLKTFLSIAESGSFRSAAQKNNISQPAVSQQMRILERKFNTVLFERSAKKVLLTPGGQILLRYAQQMLQLYKNAEAEIQHMNTHWIGLIKIASIYSMGLYQLKPLIQQFMKKYPGINIHLEYHQHDIIYEMVRNGTIDFGLVAFPKQAQGIRINIYDEDELVLVQSMKRPLIKAKKIGLQDLNGVNFIALDRKTPTGAQIFTSFQAAGAQPTIVEEYDNIETIKNTIELGRGCAVLPKRTISQELKTKMFKVVPLKDFNLKRPLAILTSKTKVFTKSTQAFYDLINKKIASGDNL